ncbi:YqkE family protein [Sutcliffiella cohnii]
MAKKKKNSTRTNKPTDLEEKISLKDQLQGDVFSKLKSMKQSLEESEQKRKEEEEMKKREERRLREKNKSFEELLNDSNMNWKEFK